MEVWYTLLSSYSYLVSGFSLDSLSAGQVFGFPANPRTTDDFDTKKHWETTITNASNAYQPSQTSQDQPSDQTPEGRPPSQMFISALPTLNISIPVTMHNHFSSWHFPQNLSRSSIQGQSGSNACTLIALTITKLFYMATS